MRFEYTGSGRYSGDECAEDGWQREAAPLQRFWQHVLPKGFVKVRYYGFFSPGLRPRLAQLREHLERADPQLDAHTNDSQSQVSEQPDHLLCPVCGQVMQKLKRIPACADKPP